MFTPMTKTAGKLDMESKKMEAKLERHSTEDLVAHFDALVKLISKRQKEKSNLDFAVAMAQLDLDSLVDPSTGET